jgi:hypothetical protein
MNRSARDCMALVILGISLAGCASPPKVVVAGKDRTGSNLYAFTGPTDLNAAASRDASRYCQKQGKYAVIQDGGYRDANFTFTCTTD